MLDFDCMSQRKIYEIVLELGGTAFPKEIKNLAREKYPDASLDSYVYYSLKKLEKWGAVEKKPDGSWAIKKNFE